MKNEEKVCVVRGVKFMDAYNETTHKRELHFVFIFDERFFTPKSTDDEPLLFYIPFESLDINYSEVQKEKDNPNLETFSLKFRLNSSEIFTFHFMKDVFIEICEHYNTGPYLNFSRDSYDYIRDFYKSINEKIENAIGEKQSLKINCSARAKFRN